MVLNLISRVRMRRVAIGSALVLALWALTGCNRTPPPSPTIVVTVQRVETRVVEVTREVRVTPTPSPTPTYSSPIVSPPGTLTYPLNEAPRLLDPQAAASEPELLVVSQLYEGLFNLRSDGLVAPAAATGYERSTDGQVYTVTLRSGLRWSDGVQLTAADFAAGFCRALEPRVASPFAHLVRDAAPITGAAEYASGARADCEEVGVTAVNTTTLRISLDAPASYFPHVLATPLFLPAPRDSGPITQTTIISGTLGTPVTGPFVLAERLPGRIVLDRNPAYWNNALVEVQRVELPVIADAAGQFTSYLEGTLQVAEFSPALGAPENPALAAELQRIDQGGVSYLGLNTRQPPTDNVLVRRAIAAAIDGPRLVAGVLGRPSLTPADRVIPPGLRQVQPNGSIGKGYDPEEARRLLAEAGYGPDNPMPPVELWYNHEGNNDAMLKAVGEMLEEAGIPVRLVSSDWTTFSSDLRVCGQDEEPHPACGFNAYRMGWVADYGEASSLLRTFGPGSGAQYTGWQSERFGELLRAASAEPDEVARETLYREAESLLLEEEAVIVPLLYYDRWVFVKDGVYAEFPVAGLPQFQFWRLRGS